MNQVADTMTRLISIHLYYYELICFCAWNTTRFMSFSTIAEQDHWLNPAWTIKLTKHSCLLRALDWKAAAPHHTCCTLFL